RRGRPSWRVALGGQRVVELLLADRALGGERREPLDVLRGFRDLRFRAGERALRLLQGGTELARVDLEEGVVATDELPLLVELPPDVPLDLGPDVRVHRPVEGADP